HKYTIRLAVSFPDSCNKLNGKRKGGPKRPTVSEVTEREEDGRTTAGRARTASPAPRQTRIESVWEPAELAAELQQATGSARLRTPDKMMLTRFQTEPQNHHARWFGRHVRPVASPPDKPAG